MHRYAGTVTVLPSLSLNSTLTCRGGPDGGIHFFFASEYPTGLPGFSPIASSAVWTCDGLAGVRRTDSCSLVLVRTQKNSSGASTPSASHSTRTCFFLTSKLTCGSL